jgi:hypothetical protein
VKIILSTLKKILFWSYERGSWQYDVMCVLILAFIFLSPNRMFHSQDTTTPHTVRADEKDRVDSIDIELMKDQPQIRDANATAIRSIVASEQSSNKNNIAGRKTTL